MTQETDSMCPEVIALQPRISQVRGLNHNHFISLPNNSAVNSVSPSAVSSNRNVCVCGQCGVAHLQKGKTNLSVSFVEIFAVPAPLEFLAAVGHVISGFLQKSPIGLIQ